MSAQPETPLDNLSLGVRILVALLVAIAGAVSIGIGWRDASDAAVVFYAVGGFCLSLAIVCVLQGRVREFFGSVLGSVVFLLGIAFLVAQLRQGVYWSTHRGAPYVMGAIVSLFVVGIPGASYALRTRFGLRKRPRRMPGNPRCSNGASLCGSPPAIAMYPERPNERIP